MLHCHSPPSRQHLDAVLVMAVELAVVMVMVMGVELVQAKPIWRYHRRALAHSFEDNRLFAALQHLLGHTSGTHPSLSRGSCRRCLRVPSQNMLHIQWHSLNTVCSTMIYWCSELLRRAAPCWKKEFALGGLRLQHSCVPAVLSQKHQQCQQVSGKTPLGAANS
jgi:hypothetical protein